MSSDQQLEALLREGMAAEARPLVAESRLTERIIAEARSEQVPAQPRSWQNWLVPAVAAVLVALLVGSVLFGAKLLHSAGQSPASHPTLPPSPAFSSNPGPSKSSSPSAPTSKSSQSGGGTIVVSPGTGPVPAGFSGYDLTWISADEGWALGTAPCSNAPCTSIVHTVDGGRTWGGLPAPSAYLTESDVCRSACAQVTGIRFASSEVGYAYGPNSFWTTADGGRSWSRQAGNAWALEVVSGHVLRVSGSDPSCAPGCRFQLQQAQVGQEDWTDVSLPGATQSVSATLSANGRTVVLASYGNPAGGAEGAQSVVFESADGGSTWRKLGEPCPRSGSEVDSVAVAVASDGSIQGLCRPRTQSSTPTFLISSTDGGQHFSRRPAVPGGSAGLLAATSADDVVVGGDRLYRWDGGAWTTVSGPGKPRFIGFENAQIGRVLADNGVWTTGDGGRSWNRLSY